MNDALWLTEFSQCNTITKPLSSSQCHTMKIENQSKNRFYEHVCYNLHIPHEDLCDTVTPICPFSSAPSPPALSSFFFFAHLLPPSFLHLTKQMEVSVDFYLNTSQGGATRLICMFGSEELSVWGHRGVSTDPAAWTVCTERSRGGERWQGQELCAAFLLPQPLDAPPVLGLVLYSW